MEQHDQRRISLADWLADEIARRRDVTTMEIAAEVGVLDGDVENWLVGRAVPTADECRRLARFLDVPEEELLSRCGRSSESQA